MAKYKVADIIFEVNFTYKYAPWVCRNYIYNGDAEPSFSISISSKDIEAERKLAKESENLDFYLESIAVLRKFCEYVQNNAQGMFFHSSAVAVDGKAYLFTAPSGTGKSTHTRLWRELLGDKVVMINDDKPIIRLIDGVFYVYGTPWNGKHSLDSDVCVPLKAICEIKQAKENSIKKMLPSEMLFTVLNQTLRPDNKESMKKYLALVDELLKKVELWQLSCNISKEAAQLSYTTMSGKEI